ncbi:MAG TPA: nucleotidyltransferase domain-containing protein [Chloroflexia bacterium]|nr:nucleotidyltransferase domain-containing protein [Chloroflexia bacterium]
MSYVQSLQIRHEERAALLQRAIEVLTGDRRVVAAWLFGSLGRGDADDLSDIDLWVVVADEHIEVVRSTKREYICYVGEPLLIEEAPQNAPPGGAYLLALYGGEAGPHQVDWYWQPQSSARLPQDTRLLFDRVGVQPAEPLPAMTHEARVEAASGKYAFFWAMANITAKKIARREGWTVLRMLDMLKYTSDEVHWLVGVRDDRPTYESGFTALPPVQPSEQLALLRELAEEMEALSPELARLGSDVSPEAIRQTYTFLGVVQSILH